MSQMKPQNQLALVVAYYLSRFDAKAYEALGYGSQAKAHDAIASAIGVKPATLSNMRDEFDPAFDNPRKGWHKREMHPTRKKIIALFQDFSGESLLALVQGIIKNKEHTLPRGVLAEIDAPVDTNTVFVPRGPTGRKAEEYFLDIWQTLGLPASDSVLDTRDQGCGYDFLLDGTTPQIAVEVKGLAGNDGGILFTDKEWETAKKMQDNYYLLVVRNVYNSPRHQIVHNPYSKLRTQQQLRTAIQISWHVSSFDLKQSLD
ncbi:protein of unknown function [Desulfomicrobium apsheronum]|uniref:Protein NO VEIN C-terminal domain-containing protein n=1 Tax=Desulfomicrobium apsheronum TaxID=52560 RepID=A0A1I3Y7F6_9BACT|nr:DUF3883 domain-containing protein [Desulfomicrobium apsheronum]SFK27755.1 protein of unknown function [Desulfomicrobium apsheronum]